jgi:hypothetical protein
MSSNVQFVQNQQTINQITDTQAVQATLNNKAAEALQMSPYLALVMAFVNSADAEQKVQEQAAGSLKVQENAMNQDAAAQQALQQQAGPSPSASQLQDVSYMQLTVEETQLIDAKTSSIDMNIQTTVQMGVANSSQRQQADLQQGSEIVQVLQGLTRGM